MKKKLIRLTESDLHKIVKESVIAFLNEEVAVKNDLDKEARRKAIEDAYAQAKKNYDETIAYQMKNYYDCVDDYSWGGPCTRAAEQSLERSGYARDLKLQELDLGYIPIEENIFALFDLDGNIVSTTIGYGQYGRYWRLNNGGGELLVFQKKCLH